MLSPSCPLSSPLLLYFLCLVDTCRVLDWKTYPVNNLIFCSFSSSVFCPIYLRIILNVSIYGNIHSSIHPSSPAYPRSGCVGSSLSRKAQISLYPATSWGDPEAFSGQPRDIVFPECPGFSLGASYQGAVP